MELHKRLSGGTEETGGKCIQKQCMCDGINGCSSGEDELVQLCGIVECREKNGGCEHLCFKTQKLYYFCQCQCYRLITKFNCETWLLL
ncbi:hypothetical protein O3P69_000688 [Scylla paramamosain]|uniref:Uncharacterized protein n=1 Tax=Scylla paramamosain TaxID=85552 RepID=A0AAW0UTW6_SCYPA